MDFVLVAAGLVGLFLGGEGLVRGSIGLARRLGLSPLLIGLTVVGFGTSTPELLVSVDAAWRGLPDIALGNVVGSNIANALLIIGIACLIWPMQPDGRSLRRDTAVMIAASVALLPFFVMGELGRLAGALLVASLVAYLIWAYRQPGPTVEEVEGAAPISAIGMSLLWLLGGLVALIVGARLLVDGSVSIARGFDISEAFIGLTIVAVGTSLPELATSAIAAFRRQSDIAIGNVVGSNIFNVLGILGVTAVISPIPVAARFAQFDLPIMIGVMVLLSALLLTQPRLGRLAGVGLLALYAGYIVIA